MKKTILITEAAIVLCVGRVQAEDIVAERVVFGSDYNNRYSTVGDYTLSDNGDGTYRWNKNTGVYQNGTFYVTQTDYGAQYEYENGVIKRYTSSSGTSSADYEFNGNVGTRKAYSNGQLIATETTTYNAAPTSGTVYALYSINQDANNMTHKTMYSYPQDDYNNINRGTQWVRADYKPNGELLSVTSTANNSCVYYFNGKPYGRKNAACLSIPDIYSGGNFPQRYNYDENGNLVSLTDENGNVIETYATEGGKLKVYGADSSLIGEYNGLDEYIFAQYNATDMLDANFSQVGYIPTSLKKSMIVKNKNEDGSYSVYQGEKFLGYEGKRIYTVEEANKVAGKKNTIKIRYR